MENSLKINIGHLNLYAKEWGDPSSDNKILAVHGWLDNADSFDPLMKQLQDAAKNDFHLIAIDLPGHGDSSFYPGYVNYTFHHLLVELKACLNALNWKKYSLMGHSLGAGALSLMAGIYADELRSLILFDGLGPLTIPDEKYVLSLRKTIDKTLKFRTLDAEKLYLLRDKRENMIKKRVQANIAGLIPQELIEILAQRSLKEHQGLSYWHFDPRLRIDSLTRFSENQVSLILKAIKAPTILWSYKGTHVVHQHLNDSIHQRSQFVKNIEIIERQTHHHAHMEKWDDENLEKFYQFLSMD